MGTTSEPSSESRNLIPLCIDSYSHLFNVSGEVNELRSFQYFQSRINEISGYAQSDFWSSLVFQVSLKETAVRHALLALSASYEVHEFGQRGLEPFNHVLHQSLKHQISRQYTKAVAVLSKNLSEDRPSLQATLITCLLFIWLEFLRNDFNAGLLHLKSGFQILRDSRSRQDLGSKVDPNISSLFDHLKIQVALHGYPNSDLGSGVLSTYAGEFLPTLLSNY